jgi:hypothetical protein
MQMGNWLQSVVFDCRYGVRQLRKNPAFTVVAVVTLAFGIGANAVVFNVMTAFLLHPLNLPQEESLYAVWRANVTAEESYPDYLDLRDRNRSFDGLAAYSIAQAGLDTGGNPSGAWVEEVSGNYFDVLRLQPSLGRFFHSSDEHGANSAPYIVLSYEYWHRHFQADRGVLGRYGSRKQAPFHHYRRSAA